MTIISMNWQSNYIKIEAQFRAQYLKGKLHLTAFPTLVNKVVTYSFSTNTNIVLFLCTCEACDTLSGDFSFITLICPTVS